MPRQQNITQYLVRNENSNYSANERPRLEEAIFELQKTSQTFQDSVGKIEKIVKDFMTEIRSEMNERLEEAERMVSDSMEEVAKLKTEISELRKCQTRRQQNEGSDDDDDDDGRAHGVDQQQCSAGGISPEILLTLANKHQRVEDNYWRSSLMLTIGSGENADYKKWLHKLRTIGLQFMLEGVRSHYVTGRGNLRLSFASEYEMRKTLIQARKYCKDNQIRNIHIEFMVPPRFIRDKKRLMKIGRENKANLGIYDVIMKNGLPVLRTFKQSDGVKYLSLNELENQTENMQSNEVNRVDINSVPPVLED